MKQAMELLTSLLIVLCSLQQTSCESSGSTKRVERKSNIVVTEDTWTDPVTARRVRRTVEDITAYTSEEAKELRDAHNDYRRQEGASGMEYMVRNESMLLEGMNLRVLHRILIDLEALFVRTIFNKGEGWIACDGDTNSKIT